MLTDQDVARLRTEIALAGVHFNHSGSSPMPAASLAAIAGHLREEQRLGAHEAAAKVQDRLDRLRADAAFLLGADTEEIAITSSGSAGWGLTFAALPPFQPGDRILVGRQEWGGNIATIQAAVLKTGAQLEVIPSRADGSVDAEALAGMVDARVKLIALTWLPANSGLINDAAAVGRVARAHDIPYFIDAGQALGQIPVSVKELGCDMLKGAGRKYLRGPRGTALLYLRKAFLPKLEPVFLDVLSAPLKGQTLAPRDDARRFETSEVSVALWLGLGESLQLARAIGIEAIAARLRPLADHLRAELARIPGVVLRDLGGPVRSGLVSFTLDGKETMAARKRLSEEFGLALGANGVAYTPFDMQARGLGDILRASVSYYNTEEDVAQLVAAVRKIAA